MEYTKSLVGPGAYVFWIPLLVIAIRSFPANKITIQLGPEGKRIFRWHTIINFSVILTLITVLIFASENYPDSALGLIIVYAVFLFASGAMHLIYKRKNSVVVKKYEGELAYVKGAHPNFLANFPDISERDRDLEYQLSA